ncbi:MULTISPECIES: alpha-ribazole phosphatase [Flavobacterium]|uniref:Alpha-ribazole phosphatase n=1 Tax=Flavobacterium hankyongi TaxID=1176532 RepID=A0ABP9A3T9_9FLAO|nr:alpha-ribazole phosphatase [Flavobacterium sp. N1846]
MEVYLVRHTETVCPKGVCYGQADVELLEPYLHQFEEIKKQLPAEALFYSSPLQRCTILANYLSTSNYNVDRRLMEMNFGSWELQNWDDIPSEEIDPWMKDFVNVNVPSGESFVELYNRVLSFIEEKKEDTSSLVIVTHAGVIRSFLCKQMSLDLKDAFSNKVDFGQVIKIIL